MIGPGTIDRESSLQVRTFARSPYAVAACVAHAAGADVLSNHRSVKPVVIDAVADRNNDTRPLMTWDGWITNSVRGATPLPHVDIGSANPRPSDVDQSFSRTHVESRSRGYA